MINLLTGTMLASNFDKFNTWLRLYRHFYDVLKRADIFSTGGTLPPVTVHAVGRIAWYFCYSCLSTSTRFPRSKKKKIIVIIIICLTDNVKTPYIRWERYSLIEIFVRGTCLLFISFCYFYFFYITSRNYSNN